MSEKQAKRSVTVRLPEDLIARIEAHRERMAKAMPGLPVTFTDAAIVVMSQGLRTVEKALGKPAGKAGAR